MKVTNSAELEAIVDYQDLYSKNTTAKSEKRAKKTLKHQASKARRKWDDEE